MLSANLEHTETSGYCLQYIATIVLDFTVGDGVSSYPRMRVGKLFFPNRPPQQQGISYVSHPAQCSCSI